jgi:uncharacterized protein (TIGR03435 family)
VKQADAPGLKPSQAQNGGGGGGGGFASGFHSSAGTGSQTKSINMQHQSIAGLIRNLQGSFDKPIVDRTGLTGNYDISLNVETPDGSTDSEATIQALSTQLGLELTASREPVEMLVVEKVKH